MQISLSLMKKSMTDSNEQIETTTHPLIKGDFLQTYEEALSFSKLKLHHEFSYRNVRIYEKEYIHQIYTKGNKDLPHLLLLHGYGGSSLTFIRLFQHIHPYYQVHALDAFGLGYSSRGPWNDQFSYEETKNYYIEAIEEWRKTLKIQTFYMVGHSFGGYLAACYCEKYPEKIEHLTLLSPAGTADQSTHPPEQRISCGRKFFLWLGSKIFNMNIKPSSSIKNCCCGEAILERVCSGRLKLRDREKDVWKEYIRQVASQEQNSEAGFYKLFDWPLRAKRPIQRIINENKFEFDINFYFGDTDWMDKTGAIRLADKNTFIKTIIIENSGHQLIFDNPKKVGIHINSAYLLKKQNRSKKIMIQSSQ